MNIGIIGSRKRNSDSDYAKVKDALAKVQKYYKLNIEDIVIVSGGCPKGGDKFAEMLHKELKFPKEMIIHKPKAVASGSPRYAYAKAFHDRDELIAEDADLLIAVVDPVKPTAGGTGYTVKYFEKVTPMGSMKVFRV